MRLFEMDAVLKSPCDPAMRSKGDSCRGRSTSDARLKQDGVVRLRGAEVGVGVGEGVEVEVRIGALEYAAFGRCCQGPCRELTRSCAHHRD